MVEEAYEKDFQRLKNKGKLDASPVNYIAEHTVTADETLSHISL